VLDFKHSYQIHHQGLESRNRVSVFFLWQDTRTRANLGGSLRVIATQAGAIPFFRNTVQGKKPPQRRGRISEGGNAA
jgi:hypothetical protein